MYTPKEMLDEEVEEEELVEEEQEAGAYVEEDEADASFCADDEEDGEDDLLPDTIDKARQWRPGTCCWAKIRSWFPARVCDSQDIPQQMKLQLGKQPSEENRIVWLFHPFSEHRIVRTRNLAQLGENREDRGRAGKGERFF